MESHADNQAMVEVSLGLAMAFFALMILAVVSMNVEPAADPCLLNDSVLVAVEQSKPAHPKPADKAKSSEHKKDHVIAVFLSGALCRCAVAACQAWGCRCWPAVPTRSAPPPIYPWRKS